MKGGSKASRIGFKELLMETFDMLRVNQGFEELGIKRNMHSRLSVKEYESPMNKI